MTLHERCATCDTWRERRASRDEARVLAAQTRTMERQTSAIHRTFHAFLRRFRNADGTWKARGMALITRIRSWSEDPRYRSGIRMVECASWRGRRAVLVLITHATVNHWMGITVFVLPVDDAAPPNEFFLYPTDHDAFIATCASIPRALRSGACETRLLHRLLHPKRAEAFMREVTRGRELTESFERRFRADAHGAEEHAVPPHRGPWRWRGYALMQRIEHWAKRQRRDRVRILHTDDAHHMNSLCCAIMCRRRTVWSGIACYAVPQNGEEPGIFFLHPRSAEALRVALTALRTERTVILRSERAAVRAHRRAFRAVYNPPP